MTLSNQVYTLLSHHDNIEKQFDATVYRTITEVDREFFISWLNEAFTDLPNDIFDFIDFAMKADGLNVNGLFVYSLNPTHEHSIYDVNKVWWEVEANKAYLFFADDDISWFVLEITTGVYWVLDKPSGTQIEQFKTLNELLVNALETAL